MPRVLGTADGRLFNFLYNADRAIAALFGAQPQSTISNEACRRRGRVWWATALAWSLEKIDPGHCAKAIKHADALIRADNGVEK